MMKSVSSYDRPMTTLPLRNTPAWLIPAQANGLPHILKGTAEHQWDFRPARSGLVHLSGLTQRWSLVITHIFESVTSGYL